MADNPFFIAAAIAALGVLGILLFGIGSFGKGGAFNHRNANRIMRYRVIAQFVAVILVMIAVWMQGRGN